MDANPSPKPLWRTIAVLRRRGPDLTDGERMAALVRWLRGETYAGNQFYDPHTARLITNPMEVNWAQFPLQAAMNETPAKQPESEPPRTRRTPPRSVARENMMWKPHDTSDESASPQSARA